jgi:hypothetical protein
MNIYLKIIIAIAVIVLGWRSVVYVKRARQAKAWCRAAYRKWLLEKSDECDLPEDDTKTLPPGGGE